MQAINVGNCCKAVKNRHLVDHVQDDSMLKLIDVTIEIGRKTLQ